MIIAVDAPRYAQNLTVASDSGEAGDGGGHDLPYSVFLPLVLKPNAEPVECGTLNVDLHNTGKIPYLTEEIPFPTSGEKTDRWFAIENSGDGMHATLEWVGEPPELPGYIMNEWGYIIGSLGTGPAYSGEINTEDFFMWDASVRPGGCGSIHLHGYYTLGNEDQMPESFLPSGFGIDAVTGKLVVSLLLSIQP